MTFLPSILACINLTWAVVTVKPIDIMQCVHHNIRCNDVHRVFLTGCLNLYFSSLIHFLGPKLSDILWIYTKGNFNSSPSKRIFSKLVSPVSGPAAFHCLLFVHSSTFTITPTWVPITETLDLLFWEEVARNHEASFEGAILLTGRWWPVIITDDSDVEILVWVPQQHWIRKRDCYIIFCAAKIFQIWEWISLNTNYHCFGWKKPQISMKHETCKRHIRWKFYKQSETHAFKNLQSFFDEIQ